MDQSFAEQYADPRWKDKADEMEWLADYKCEICDRFLPEKLIAHHGYAKWKASQAPSIEAGDSGLEGGSANDEATIAARFAEI